MLRDEEARAPSRFGRHRLDAAVPDIGRAPALEADQVVVMNLGEVVQAGTPIELFELLVLADLRARGFSVHQLQSMLDVPTPHQDLKSPRMADVNQLDSMHLHGWRK